MTKAAKFILPVITIGFCLFMAFFMIRSGIFAILTGEIVEKYKTGGIEKIVRFKNQPIGFSLLLSVRLIIGSFFIYLLYLIGNAKSEQ